MDKIAEQWGLTQRDETLADAMKAFSSLRYLKTSPAKKPA